MIPDEAQRIKNWQTKTARAVKGLRSPYAFVLTGTPLQNRIDASTRSSNAWTPGCSDLCSVSIVPSTSSTARPPVGYRNLEEMHRLLEPVAACRRKSDVEDQLPDRTVRNHVVAMDPSSASATRTTKRGRRDCWRSPGGEA